MDKIATKCRIEWINTETNFEGHGEWHPIEKFPILKELAKKMSMEYPHIKHIVVNEHNAASN